MLMDCTSVVGELIDTDIALGTPRKFSALIGPPTGR